MLAGLVSLDSLRLLESFHRVEDNSQRQAFEFPTRIASTFPDLYHTMSSVVDVKPGDRSSKIERDLQVAIILSPTL